MDKGEVKAGAIYELGNKFDDMLTSAQREVDKGTGATLALQEAVKKVAALAAAVDKDLDEGIFSKFEDPMAVASLLKKQITRACSVLETGAISAENHRLIATGRFQAFHQMVENMKKLHDLELLKVQAKRAQEAALARGEELPSRGKPVGTAPAPSIKQRRLAEESAPPPVVPAVKTLKKSRSRKSSRR